jgi:hypothetical protein
MRTSIMLAAILALVAPSAAVAETLSYDVIFNDSVLSARTDALSVGDRIIINDRLLTGGVDVGTSTGLCTIIDTEKSTAICNVSFSVEGGMFAVQFVNSPPPEKHFPITGATGAYEGRGGVGTLVEHGDDTGSVSFTIN